MKKVILKTEVTKTENTFYCLFSFENEELKDQVSHGKDFLSVQEIESYKPTAAQEMINALGISSEYEYISEDPLTLMAKDWIDFGTDLFKEIRKKIWVINASDPNVTEQDIIALIPHSDLLQKALEGGGLGTAKIICEQLKVALPKYLSVCDFAIEKITFKIGG